VRAGAQIGACNGHRYVRECAHIETGAQYVTNFIDIPSLEIGDVTAYQECSSLVIVDNDGKIVLNSDQVIALRDYLNRLLPMESP
jgi:hypothetical protein